MQTEFVDTIIIGAGLSGIGAAYHLQKNCPNKSLAILEGRDTLGGTWDLFRYPGVRSDSDMFTYGYEFKPWIDKDSLATGDKLLKYLDDAAQENNIKTKIRYNHKVTSLSWCSETARWTLQVEVNGQSKVMESSFVLSCTGYYDYNKGYQPEFKNQKAFKGDFIHPQHWPKDYNYSNKKIVVIGSGATAVTLIPSLAKKAKHVTMLQRSPTYVVAIPQQDAFLKLMYWCMPKSWVAKFARARNLFVAAFLYKYMTKNPEKGKKFLHKNIDKHLSKDIDRKHFTPKYNPWDQRLCVVPDADLFEALNDGSASIETEHIEEFTESGIQLKNGKHLDADLIVSATGLNVSLMSGMDITVDEQPIVLANKMFYRGILIEDVPNFGFIFGYTNSSWTLKAELVSQYVCRIINHMHKSGRPICIPKDTKNSKRELFLNLSSGYVVRAQQQIPKQGSEQPWRLDQDYKMDKKRLHGVAIEDGVLQFSVAGQCAPKKSTGKAELAQA